MQDIKKRVYVVMKKLFCLLMASDFFVCHCTNFILKIFQTEAMTACQAIPKAVLKRVLNRLYQTNFLNQWPKQVDPPAPWLIKDCFHEQMKLKVEPNDRKYNDTFSKVHLLTVLDKEKLCGITSGEYFDHSIKDCLISLRESGLQLTCDYT